jgi:Na+-driven multidrug efflux pump
MVSIGIQQATSMLIGKQIGKGDVKAAKDWYRATNIVAFVIIVTLISNFAIFG